MLAEAIMMIASVFIITYLRYKLSPYRKDIGDIITFLMIAFISCILSYAILEEVCIAIHGRYIREFLMLFCVTYSISSIFEEVTVSAWLTWRKKHGK